MNEGGRGLAVLLAALLLALVLGRKRLISRFSAGDPAPPHMPRYLDELDAVS